LEWEGKDGGRDGEGGFGIQLWPPDLGQLFGKCNALN
jgi:hypothetical protein